MSDSSLGCAIAAHLELQERNSNLEAAMPISRYRDLFAAAFADDAVASRGVAAECPDADPPTERIVALIPWADPDSWWNVREPLAGWSD